MDRETDRLTDGWTNMYNRLTARRSLFKIQTNVQEVYSRICSFAGYSSHPVRASILSFKFFSDCSEKQLIIRFCLNFDWHSLCEKVIMGTDHHDFHHLSSHSVTNFEKFHHLFQPRSGSISCFAFSNLLDFAKFLPRFSPCVCINFETRISV